MKQIISTIFYSGVTFFIAFSLIKFPDQSLEASIRGLNMWWEIVFPSLLPFFITAELLIGFGVVKFIGVLCEPIMRPLFNVPGTGSFPWAMGMASGYPTGAKITARLREEKQLTQIEAERLVSFTNASSPLFIFAAISVGFFNDAKLGILLAAAHYTGNTLVGISMRFYGRKKEKKDARLGRHFEKFPIAKAFQEMHQTRIADSRPFGKIFGDAVTNSVQTLLMVGGFIIMFSVLAKLLFLLGISPFIAIGFEYMLQILTLPVEFALPFISGLFEVTLGAQAISVLSVDSLLQQAIVISFILGFNGLSIQAQVASIIAKTDIRFKPYFYARFLHGLYASILTIIMFKPLYLNRKVIDAEDIPVSNDIAQHGIWVNMMDTLKEVGPVITIFFLGLAIVHMYQEKKKP